MGFTTVAFSQSQDEGGVLLPVAGVPDQSIRINGNDVVVPPEMNKLVGALACIGTTGVRAQLVSPSLRRTNPYDIRPFVLGLFPTTLEPANFHPLSPVSLETNEPLDCNVHADPAAAEQQSVVAWLADGPLAPVAGKIIRARFTWTAALVAGVWANAPIVFPDGLPVGIYSIVGAYMVAATAVVARFVPVGAKWRPGFPVAQTAAGLMDDTFRFGNLGKWCDFDQVTPPSLDVLSSAAAGSATYTGVVDLIPAQG